MKIVLLMTKLVAAPIEEAALTNLIQFKMILSGFLLQSLLMLSLMMNLNLAVLIMMHLKMV